MNRKRDTETTRRAVLRRAGGTLLLGAGLAAGSAPAAAQSEPDYGGWFDDVSNYDGTVDETGSDRVTIRVGTQANGGGFGFGPAAVRVSPGTQVVWRWTGEGGSHNVVAEDGAYESELTAESGFTYSRTYDSEGIYKYYCEPHRTLGMKGAVVVGEDGGGGGGGGGEGGGPSAGVALVFQALSGLLAGLFALVLAVVAYAYGRYRRPELPEAEQTPDRVTESETDRGIVRKLDHDEFDPTGTAALITVYFAVLVLMWVFMYFVEFLGNGPTIIG